MAKPPSHGGADASAMARAILGAGARIIGATFSGNASASGVNGTRTHLSTGQGTDGATPSSFLDIDFVPETSALDIGLTLAVDEVPLDGASAMLDRGVSIWLNGKPLQKGGDGTAAATARHSALPVNPAPDAGLSISFRARLGMARGQLQSIRIATAALGTAAVGSVLYVTPAEAAPGGGRAVGNPNTGNNGNDSAQGNAGGAAGGANGGGNGNGNSGNGGGNGGPGGGIEDGANDGGGSSGGGNDGSGNYVANDDAYDIPINSSATVDVTLNDIGPGQSQIFVVAINGQPVEAGDTVTLSTGEVITINADGTLTITTDGDLGATTFQYTAVYGQGNAQQIGSADVTINSVPCFVAGTRIRTASGDVAVETLQVGDLVMTRDSGPKSILWIGQRTLDAEGRMAPIRIERDTFGKHGTLWVSPQHRIFLRDAHAELLFGSSEILVAAKDLVDGKRVRQIEGGQVTYVHFLFDQHEIVWSEGLMTESFLPGPQSAHCFPRETIEEILEIFPMLDPETGDGYGTSVRPALKGYEARVLVA